MKLSEIGSPRTVSVSSKVQSLTSSRQRISLGGLGKGKKFVGKHTASALLLQRQTAQLIEDGVDVTPKMLRHPYLSSIDERQLTAFEALSLSQAGSSGQLTTSSSVIFKALSARTTSSVACDVMKMESILSAQAYESVSVEDENSAPLQFYLPSIDPNEFLTRPDTVKITLKETETFFIFEMEPLTADLETPEGIAIKAQNDRYEYITTGEGSNRKLLDAETQTTLILRKSRATHTINAVRKNTGMFVNNWVIHDTLSQPELLVEVNGKLVVQCAKDAARCELEPQETLQKLEIDESKMKQQSTLEDQAIYIFRLESFKVAVRVMERIIENNVFLTAQKRFTGLIKQDPCSLDLEFTYSLNLLWTHSCELSHGRPVPSFRWNDANSSILAVAYGAREGSDTKDGVLLIWCMKNPSQPGLSYTFENPISDIDWSRERPNLLAVGFYNGTVKVIDVSTMKLNVIRQSEKRSSPASEPHWQVQWWPGDEQYNYKEQIYTSNQDGRIFCYRATTEDFTSTVIMKIFRLEGKLPGIPKTHHCRVYDIPISRSPGALVLRRHPTSSTIYFVGSDEGCIYKCSTNYLTEHIESFVAHDGPIYAMEFSPFCPKIFLTCGADWCTRIWAEGLCEPLITLSTTMACVRYAAWSPKYSTVIASIVNNEICVWDIRKKTYIPTSVTVSPDSTRLVMLGFTWNGDQLVVADVEGAVHVYSLEGMPFPPYNQQEVLIESIERALLIEPDLLRKLRKLGPLT